MRGIRRCTFRSSLRWKDEDGIAGLVKVEILPNFQLLLVEVFFEILEPFTALIAALLQVVIFFLKGTNALLIMVQIGQFLGQMHREGEHRADAENQADRRETTAPTARSLPAWLRRNGVTGYGNSTWSAATHCGQYLFISLNSQRGKRMSNKILVFCSAPSLENATSLAQTVVEEKLAACVNILPGVTSIYRWEGAVESSTEVLLLIKTREELFELLRARIVEQHPYELPEVIAVSISNGHAEYLKWIGSSTDEL